jgi:hypothetical protein
MRSLYSTRVGTPQHLGVTTGNTEEPESSAHCSGHLSPRHIDPHVLIGHWRRYSVSGELPKTVEIAEMVQRLDIFLAEVTQLPER